MIYLREGITYSKLGSRHSKLLSRDDVPAIFLVVKSTRVFLRFSIENT
jgi:hypothetical protein